MTLLYSPFMIAHTGCDVSVYQEFGILPYDADGVPAYQYGLHPMKWALIKGSIYNFEFGFIKFSHGMAVPGKHPDAYPIDTAIRQMKGMKSVGIKWGPYHYHYYKINGIIIPIKDQFEAYKVAVGDNVSDIGWEEDIEDTSAFDILNFWDTPSANKSLAQCVALFNDLLWMLRAISEYTGKLAVPYSGPWWWNPFARFLNGNGHADLVQEFMKYPADCADYTPPLDDSIGLNETIWQDDSTPDPAVPGVAIGEGKHFDILKWLKSEAEWQAFAGVPVTPPPVLTDHVMTIKLWDAHPEIH